MFMQNFKYTFKTLFRNRTLIFWTFAFPIILGSFFKVAFSNIENSEKLDIIDIAIVNTQSFQDDAVLKEAFATLADTTKEDQMFQISYTSQEEAKQLLEEDKVIGYLLFEQDSPKVVIKANGINETVFNYAVDEILQTKKILEHTVPGEMEKQYAKGNININPEEIYTNVLDKIQKEEPNIENISNTNLSYTMIEFYTLIAMACLYGGLLGMTAINQTLANMSSKGKRVSVSPVSKGKLILSSVLASYVTQVIGLVILFAYTIFVLKVDYGTNLPMIMLLSLSGSLAGLTLGLAIASVFKMGDNAKTGAIISFTMLGCFLSGMMGITMKYVVDKSIPIVNKLNPASMITDGFYSLYYYDTLDRYFFNVVSLLIFSLIMMGIAYISLRRQKYDSI